MEEINDLAVHSLDGEMYGLFRAYLEKHGCTWREKRGRQGELLSVHLTFPPGTTCKKLPPIERFDRYQINFNSGGLLFWSVRLSTGLNGVSVPYVYL